MNHGKMKPELYLIFFFLVERGMDGKGVQKRMRR